MICDTALKTFSALGPVAISFAVLYVAWQQWKTARDKLQFDRYENRFKVYQEVLDFIGTVSFGEATPKDVVKFDIACNEAFFLFGGDTSLLEHLLEIRNKADASNNLKAQIDAISGPQNDQRTALVKERLKIKSWLMDQPKVTRNKFVKHLTLR